MNIAIAMHHRVTLVNPQTGQSHTLDLPEDQSIWKGAAKQGLKLTASCQQGSCLTCVVKVTAGTVEHQKKVYLTPEEKAEGFALSCCAVPKSDCTILLEQEQELLAEIPA